MEAAMPSDIDWRFRPMFGGIGAYAGDKMCVSLCDVGLAVKLAGAEHAALLALPGARPLQYEPNSPPSKSYVVVPDRLLGDRRALGRWLAAAAALALSAPRGKLRKTTQKRANARRRKGSA